MATFLDAYVEYSTELHQYNDCIEIAKVHTNFCYNCDIIKIFQTII